MNWLVGDNVASSGAYFIGWMASGYGGAWESVSSGCRRISFGFPLTIPRQ
nr:hypothetical protein [uncultured Methanoregula sp.]